jgi:hypothetical protein
MKAFSQVILYNHHTPLLTAIQALRLSFPMFTALAANIIEFDYENVLTTRSHIYLTCKVSWTDVVASRTCKSCLVDAILQKAPFWSLPLVKGGNILKAKGTHNSLRGHTQDTCLTGKDKIRQI